MTTLIMKTTDRVITTTGSTFKPGDSSVYSPMPIVSAAKSSSCYHLYALSIVLVLPPAPAALVLAGRAFATLSCRSAAALLRIIVFGPPGGFGDDGRAPLELADPGVLPGALGGGDDCNAVCQRISISRRNKL